MIANIGKCRLMYRIRIELISETRKYNGIFTASIIWLVVIAAGFGAALLRGVSFETLWLYGLIAAVPALLSLSLRSLLHKEWARLVVIFAWISLAVFACLGISFWPFAILFLCAPVMAALFEREMIIEALFLSAVISAVIYGAGLTGNLPTPLAPAGAANWLALIAPLGTAALALTALFSASQTRARHGAFQTLPAAAVGDTADILDTLPGGFLRVSKTDKITFASKSAYTMFGLPRDAGHLPLQAISPKDAGFRTAFTKLLEQAKTTGTTASATIMREQGHQFFDVSASPTEDGFLIQGHDVSARERDLSNLRLSQQELERSIADKTLFFSGVSHELRTPLNAIIGFSDMMRTRLFGPLPGKYAEYADLIHDSGQHMLDLIGDVLDMSKVEAGKYTLHYGAFDMADVVRSSVKMVRPSADAAQVMITVDVPTQKDFVIEADRKAVRQILLNLLSNGIKFTPKGGEVKVSIKSMAQTLLLNVSDNGLGMSADELRTVGEPYSQSSSAQQIDSRGSGLGLSLVKSLVDLHGGRFAIASQPKEGTSVDIYLPTGRQP